MIPPHTNIQTVQGSPATAGMVGGWHIPEPIGTWSSGSPSSLFLTLPPLDTDNLLIEITFMPYEWHFAAGEGFELDVLIGTCPVRTIRRMHPGAVTELFRVPARRALDAHRVLRITIRGMTGLAPNLFGENDSRALSFMLTDIAVRPMRSFALEPGMSIPLGQASLTLLLENWHEPDLEWAWSPGGIETRLQLQLSPPTDEEDEIRIGLDLEVYSELLTRGPATLQIPR